MQANERTSRAAALRWPSSFSSMLTRTLWTRRWVAFSPLIALRHAGKRTGAARRGSRPRPAEQPQRVAFVAAEAKEKALPPSVGRFTTPLDNGQRLNTRKRSTEPHRATTKKALSTAPVAADAATNKQRCSPSSREQQDSPSRSRRARPSGATRGTSSPSVVKCARRRRKTAACSARCDEVIR